MHLLSPARLLSTLALVPSIAFGFEWQCQHTLVDGVNFDLKPLGGVHTVLQVIKTQAGTFKNRTFTFDICDNLERKSNNTKRCPQGTRVCAAERIYDDDTKEEPTPDDVWPIAGQFTLGSGANLNAKFTRLKNSESANDAELEGVRVQVEGGEHEKVPQRASFEFVCDKSRTGLDNEDEKEEGRRVRRADNDDDDDSKQGQDEDDGSDNRVPQNGSLQLLSYRSEPVDNKPNDLLRIRWYTKYACEDAADEGGSGKSSSWGFFTWLFLIVFLGVAGYLVFGAWLNYNRYGARGWDLVPHGDTIRDVPYILKDWGRKVVSTVQGGGRGGYSAV